MHYLKPLLIVAGVAAIIAVFPMQYGYYQIMRIVVTGAAVFGAYHAYHANNTGWVWILGGIAVLFNPIIPIHLSRESWFLPDLVAGALLIAAALKLKFHKGE